MGAPSGIELPTASTPTASILIVSKRAGPLIRGCLERLAAIAPKVPFETIVVLNGCAPDEVGRLRSDVSGAEVLYSDVNLGSAGGLNLARPHARGDYIICLHDDARPAPGWLDALVRAAESEPSAAAVGSLVLNEDGSVQAAGWELLPDGSTRPPWGGDPPPAPSTFTERRAVDYAPTCSLLVRSTAWDRVGGIDERYYPAYYTDVDLALAFRARGMNVLCEPASVVVHHRGASSTPRYAWFVATRNRGKLLDKWGELVTGHAPGSATTFLLPEDAIPPQEFEQDPARRERAQLTRLAEVSEAYTTKLSADLLAVTGERDHSRAELAETVSRLEQAGGELTAVRVELSAVRGELAATRQRLESVDQRLRWLEWRADQLAHIEAGGWWRLRGRLMPLLRAGAALRRRLRRAR